MINFLVKKFQAFIKKNQNEIKSMVGDISSNIPAELQENRRLSYKSVVQQKDKYRSGEITKQQLRQDIILMFTILGCFDKTTQEDILRLALEIEADVKKDSNFTNDEYDIYSEIVSYLLNKRQEKIKILLKKAAQKINNQELPISKRTIDFITSITDEELEILKKIFRYVVGNGIFKYKDIEQDFMKMGFCQSGGDNIKFLGEIFFNQDAIGGKAYIKKIEAIEIENIFIWKDSIALNGITATEECLKNYLSNEENKKEFQKFLENDFKYQLLDKGKIKFHITKQPTSTGIITLNIDCLTILADMGVEIYSLLKDEIENYPTEYLEALINDEQYKNFGLVYEKTV